MIEWIYYSRSRRPPELALSVVQAFSAVAQAIDPAAHDLNSNDVLAVVAPGLTAIAMTLRKFAGSSKPSMRVAGCNCRLTACC